MTKFGELLGGLCRSGDDWSVAVGEDGLQRHAVYGGLAAALCLKTGRRSSAPQVRHRDSQAPSSLTSLIALADALPLPALALAKQFGPISTMTWSIDVLSTTLETSEGWWLVHAESETIAGGQAWGRL
jgi:hypothetical protein